MFWFEKNPIFLNFRVLSKENILKVIFFTLLDFVKKLICFVPAKSVPRQCQTQAGEIFSSVCLSRSSMLKTWKAALHWSGEQCKDEQCAEWVDAPKISEQSSRKLWAWKDRKGWCWTGYRCVLFIFPASHTAVGSFIKWSRQKVHHLWVCVTAWIVQGEKKLLGAPLTPRSKGTNSCV